MKDSQILFYSNHKKLRNGKIITPRKKNSIQKKKKILNFKKDKKLSLFKTSPIEQDSLNKKNSFDMTVTKHYGNLVDNRSLYILLEKIPSFITDVHFGNGNNNNSNKYCYTNLEDYIVLNELQIYNDLQPKVESRAQLITKVKSKKPDVPLGSVNTEKNLQTKSSENHSVTDQNIDVRMTRGKTVKYQIEERKQLDKIIFDKFPNNTFKMFVIQLDDITEEIKFLRTLGLICRFKCLLTPAKLKNKH